LVIPPFFVHIAKPQLEMINERDTPR